MFDYFVCVSVVLMSLSGTSFHIGKEISHDYLVDITASSDFLTQVLSALECTDWQGKSVADGIDFYPKEEDACYMCRCDKGYSTMCKTVSCAPPNCRSWHQIPGKCCQFECLEAGVADSADNSTGLPPLDTGVSGTPTDSTMTDLGLRLVASTVTTFLILALLLFLIHRLRQRRLLMALRRYSRRREQYDDSDNISYSPEYYGIQCPPYEDPPPPYSPPKPLHIHHGEQPPPYEIIDTNGNSQITTGNHPGNTVFTNTRNGTNGCVTENDPAMSGNTSGVLNGSAGVMSDRNNGDRTVGSGNVQNGNRTSHDEISSYPSLNLGGLNGSFGAQNQNTSAQDRNLLSVHFKNNSTIGQPSITMGVQNRGRNNRYRFSDGNFNLNQNRNWLGRNAALNLEIRNTIQNLQNNSSARPLSEIVQNRRRLAHNSGEQSSSTTDIGESSTSAESLESSPSFSPVSPESEEVQSQKECSSENLADDADSTVRQFLDRQFGPLAKQRRYPTTMSQSWTSAVPSTPNVRQSVSVGSFLVSQDDTSNTGSNRRGNSSVVKDCQKVDNMLSRSKSEQLKTNGSLRNPPFKNIVRSQTTNLPQPGYAARVSYVEPEEITRSFQDSRKSMHSDAANVNSSSQRSDSCIDYEPSECSSSELNMSHLSTSNVEPGDIIVTKRQDDLRELRLSHLLHNARNRFENPKSLPTSPVKNNGLTKLQTSQSARSVDSSALVCSETGEKSTVGVAISNDAQYPDNSYRNVNQSSSAISHSSADGQNDPNILSSSRIKLNRSEQTDTNHGDNSYTQSNSTHSTTLKQAPGRVLHGSPHAAMSQSWHGNQNESSDENTAVWHPRTDTLGRNVNTNFDKKTCIDKDVSNLFFPLFKQINKEVEQHRNSVPSSDMRACASQLYNCETEEKSAKKDKKKYFLKRHSAGCFPVKRESAMCDNHSHPKLSHRLKSCHVKERQLAQTFGANDSCGQNSNKKTNLKRTSEKERKEYGFIDNPDVGNNKHDKLGQVSDGCSGSKADFSPPCLIQASFSPPVHLIESKRCPREGAAEFGTKVNDSIQYSPNAEGRRSKSLGRGEKVNSSSVDKKSENISSRRPTQGRKKKNTNRLSFPGTANSFNRELEHVLESQKVAIKSSMAKAMMCRASGQDAPLCAVTQV